jgi:alkyl sulfatase BDS1-like metallo-beta-lactamase superfamily hydrolase
MSDARKPASEHTAERNREALGALPFDSEDDLAEAHRGLVAPFEPPYVEDERGRTVWDLRPYEFLDGEPPDTAHPSLWRLARLSRTAGLFELAPGLYQLRGFDLSNMHVIEGEDGIVVVDPLISTECAATALALYREHRGDRPVTGLLYTHSHVDHFGGARGVISPEEAEERRVPILAPAGFLHHAVSENVHAGVAMGRRAGYMFGAQLDRGPDGQLGAGLGQTNSTGTISLIPPTIEIASTGQEEVVDGVRLAFQLTPGTEAPAEMNFHLPELRALCIADNAARAMHNLLTLRGALVRDARVWANYLDEAIELFSGETDVLFGGHHWPCWEGERIVEFLEKQRDLYTYLHDQTLRLLNRGHNGPEIAELVELPPSLAREWHCREYYGSISHNVKAIYQRYMGWFDGNPAHLWEHPPVERARRYVASMGGAEAVLERARDAFEAGDYARELQADTLEQLGYGAENATWRNFFLAGAAELREGPSERLGARVPPDIVAGLSVGQLLDAMAIRLDGPRAWDLDLRLDWVVTEPDEERAITVRNGVLRHRTGRHAGGSDATLAVTREALNQLVLKTADLAALAQGGQLRVEGDGARIGELLSLLEEPGPSFPIVTPRLSRD